MQNNKIYASIIVAIAVIYGAIQLLSSSDKNDNGVVPDAGVVKSAASKAPGKVDGSAADGSVDDSTKDGGVKAKAAAKDASSGDSAAAAKVTPVAKASSKDGGADTKASAKAR